MRKINLILTGFLILSLTGCQSPKENTEKIQNSEVIENVDEVLLDEIDEIEDSFDNINDEINKTIKASSKASVTNITREYITENQIVPVEGNPRLDEFLGTYNPDKEYVLILENLPSDKMKDEYFNYTYTIDNEFNVNIVENN